MGCATTTVKITWIFFNILFAIMAIGSIIYMGFNPDDPNAEHFYIAYILSGLILLFSLLGCFAALRESVPLLLVTAIFYLLLAVAHIAGASFTASNGDLNNGLEVVTKAWDNNEMDRLQREHQCCGKDSAQDYVMYNKPIPVSCYKGDDTSNTEGLYAVGCSSKLVDYHETEEKFFMIGFGVLIVLQIIGFLLGLFLAINLRHKQRRLRF